MPIELQTWCADWKLAYRRAAASIEADLAIGALVEHVGSTAIDNVPSKPIIDMLVGLENHEALERAREKLIGAGWLVGTPSGDVTAFLRHPPTIDLPELNAHLTLIGDQAWADLRSFRDWLSIHPAQAEAYGNLKLELAANWSEDLEAYTVNKAPFVCGVLASVNSVNGTLGHQREALGTAVVFRCISIGLQMAIATAAMLSVLASGPDTLVVLAGLIVLLLALWLASDWACRKQLSQGEQARRLIQVEYGLGQTVAERSLIAEDFAAPRASLKGADVSANFATRAPPGMRRLAEMIDESAFFSAAIQKRSAFVTAVFLALVAVAAFLGFLLVGPRAEDTLLTVAIRMFMAFAVFLLSADVIGAALAHAQAAAMMDNIRMRISAARGRAFPDGDVLQAMIDYNATVAGAPPPLPLVYELIRANLTAKWQAHKAIARIGF